MFISQKNFFTAAIFVALILPAGRTCRAQIPSGPDTTRISSSVPGDSLRLTSGSVRRDSIPRVKPIPLVGALEPFRDSTESILSSEIPWIEYRYIGDLLWTKPGMYIRDMGDPGQKNELTIGGVDWRGIAFLVDGRSHSDPITGSYDMVLFPTDYAERIEFITGPRAMVYGMNATGGTINVVTKSFYTNKAFSRLRYSQGVNEYAQTDALFSQNIFTGFNFMFGLTRHTIGSHRLDQDNRARFPNADHDAWSFRTKLRYNISNSFNIVLSQLSEQTQTGLNGGVDYVQSGGFVFDEIGSTVSNYEAYEKINDKHLDLTAAAYLTGDTMQVTKFSVYYSNQLRLYRDEDNQAGSFTRSNGIFIQSDHRSSEAGVLLRHNGESAIHRFEATVQAEQIQVEESPDVGRRRESKFSASAKEEVLLFSPLTFAVFGRLDRYRAENLFGEGFDAQIAINPSFGFFGGVSLSKRTPTLQELYWSGDSPRGTTRRLWLKSEDHTVIEAGMRFSLLEFLSGTVSVTHREIRNPILIDSTAVFESSPLQYYLQFTQPNVKRSYDGLNIHVKASVGTFFAEGNGTYLKQPETRRDGDLLILLPELYLDGSVYYKDIIAGGNLDLKVGFRGRFTSKQSGMAPLGESGVFVPYTVLNSFGPSGTADFFLIGKLGDAYIHFVWENLSGNKYMLTPVYPMYDRNVRFGVSWEFWN